MEKRVNTKIEEYIKTFKDAIRNKVIEIDFDDKSKTAELVEFVYDYTRLTIQKEDLSKRKRVKNCIPNSNRCNAKRANGEQCTRRRKDECEFCGTHSKGTPHGVISQNTDTLNLHKHEVFAEEIKGIVYYIDSFNNVYKTEDIMDGKENPRIVAKYTKAENGYTIPEFGLV
jgi:hypothetical protein